jgi:hypothetical protein
LDIVVPLKGQVTGENSTGRDSECNGDPRVRVETDLFFPSRLSFFT